MHSPAKYARRTASFILLTNFSVPRPSHGALYRNDDIDPVITTLTEDSFRELMRLATSEVEFSFNGEMYRQIDGVAIGFPLGPTLANIFVGFYGK